MAKPARPASNVADPNNGESVQSPEVSADLKTAKRARPQRPFPATIFEEPLAFAKKVLEIGSGQPVKRLTLFHELGKSPESGPSRQLIINSGRYGLTRGGIQADNIELTEDGRKCVDETVSRRESARAQIELGIMKVEVFKQLYARFEGNKLPAHSVIMDAARDVGVDNEFITESIETFIVNLRFVGLLKTLSGAERIVPVDMHLDALPTSGISISPSSVAALPRSSALITGDQAQFELTCFYIAPIGDEGSEARKHSDLFLGSFVEPAVEEFGLTVVRADAIDKPGVITRQIIDYVMKSRVVIADLSYHNPNVFYELALRHAVKLPIVQISRAADRVPFDISQMRTVLIDTSDIYTLLPRVDSYRAEIAAQVRRSLERDYVVDTPISIYFPDLRVAF